MPQLMDNSAPVVPWLGAKDLRLQLSERIQYLTLGISAVLLLLALGILAWQVYQWCTTYTNKGMGWQLNHIQSCTAQTDTIFVFLTRDTIINKALFSLFSKLQPSARRKVNNRSVKCQRTTGKLSSCPSVCSHQKSCLFIFNNKWLNKTLSPTQLYN